MMQLQEPEYYIKIGIKDNKVVNINWEEISNSKEFKKAKDKWQLYNIVEDYLKQAIRMIK